MSQSVLVLGGGVIGLSCAIKLLEEGYDVRVIADRFGKDTTSSGAAGIWHPFIAEPMEKIKKWSFTTDLETKRLISRGSVWPCWIGKVLSLSYTDKIPDIEKKDYLENFELIEKETNRGEGVKSAVTYTVPFYQTLRYLEHMMCLIISLGGNISRCSTIKSIDEVIESYPNYSIIVNCLGIGAKDVICDEEVFPVRGVLVYLKPQPSIQYSAVLAENNPKGLTYFMSRPDACILGGTAIANDWNTKVTDGEIESILERIKEIEPEFRKIDLNDQIERVWVGLRPARTMVRLELDKSFRTHVVHCYGHGGSGWTTHWGCALEVLEIVKKELPNK